MKKRRPKPSKFKVPGKSKKRRKNRHEEEDTFFPFKNYHKLSIKDREKLYRLEEFYISAIRNFYNSIVDEDLKVSPETIFLTVNNVPSSSGLFDMEAVANDILFHFVGDGNNEILTALLQVLFEVTGEDIEALKRDSVAQILLKLYESRGYTPLKNKVICVVQETPTAYFSDRDEITIDINNEEYLSWAGFLSSMVYKSLKDNLHMDSLKVKVINKKNNPKAYKNYLKLKQIMKRVEELEESVS